MRSNHSHLSIASHYIQLGSWSVILRSMFPKLAKFDFEQMWSAKNDIFQRLLWTGMWRRRRVIGPWTTIDALKGRSDVTIERRCGRFIEFGCTAVSNHRHPPKNPDLMFAQNDAAKIEMAPFLKKIRWEYLYNFWYFLPATQHEGLMHCFCGLGASKWIFSCGLLGSIVFFGALGWAQQSAGVPLMLKLNREGPNLVQSCQGMYQRMELCVSVMCQ
jgi:hypothetical protein